MRDARSNKFPSLLLLREPNGGVSGSGERSSAGSSPAGRSSAGRSPDLRIVLARRKVLLCVLLCLAQPVAAQPVDKVEATQSSAVASAPETASEQSDKNWTLTQAITETTMSPFCPGRTISSCPSPQARELRSKIHTWLQDGYTEDGVRNQIRLIYGQEVEGIPNSAGWLGKIGWAAPAIFVALSLIVVFIKLRQMGKAGDVSSTSNSASKPAESFQAKKGNSQNLNTAVELELQARLKK